MMKRTWYLAGVATLAAVLAATGFVLLSCRTGAAPGTTPTRTAKPHTPPPGMPAAIRGIWVARFHYHYPDDVRTIIKNCAEIGCNTIYWQVRGEGTVAYPSKLEPWSREYGFRDPGFDPLAIAVAEAHRHGLRIEAYVNVMPGWKGKQPPPPGRQLYHAHPDWFMHDQRGRRQPLGDFYVILNPCLPEVRNHITSVIAEIVTNYDVDGVHLDYVRYAWDDEKGAKQNYPRDPRTLALFRQATGKAPDDDPAAWDRWRAARLTQLVAEIRTAVSRHRPGTALTAAVWRDARRGYRDYLQDSVGWLKRGLIDAAMPMAYTKKPGQFSHEIDAYRQLAGGGRVVPAVGLYLHDQPRQTREQLLSCLGWSGEYALFSYDSLFPTAGDRRAAAKTRAANQRLRHQRRAVIEACMSR